MAASLTISTVRQTGPDSVLETVYRLGSRWRLDWRNAAGQGRHGISIFEPESLRIFEIDPEQGEFAVHGLPGEASWQATQPRQTASPLDARLLVASTDTGQRGRILDRATRRILTRCVRKFEDGGLLRASVETE